MQTIHLKYDIISWITGLDDKKLITELHEWIEERKSAKVCALPKRNGSLTAGYGIWANDAPFDETDYRDRLWQTKENVW